MALRFRNLTVTPNDPVAEWGVEGILIALERGGADDWRKTAFAVAADESGDAALDFEEAASIAEGSGAVAVVRNMVAYLTRSARESTVYRLKSAFASTEMTQADVARLLGTSASRLSTYLSGKTMPSAEVLVQLEDLASTRIAEVRFI